MIPGYLCLLPALGNAKELVVVVIATAGAICLQELQYTKHLLEAIVSSPNPPSPLPGITMITVTAMRLCVCVCERERERERIKRPSCHFNVCM